MNTIKNLTLIVVAVVLLASCGGNNEQARDAAVKSAVVSAEVANADIVWTAYKITGDSHTGTLSISESDLKMEEGKLVGGSFVVDMNSLENTDLQGEWHDKLVGHLKSDDFFSVEKHKTSKFEITGVTATASGYQLTGNLIIKGISNEISFKAKSKKENGQVVLTANFDVDRTLYEVKYGSSKFFEGLGDKVIKDNFNLDIRVVAQNNQVATK